MDINQYTALHQTGTESHQATSKYVVLGCSLITIHQWTSINIQHCMNADSNLFLISLCRGKFRQLLLQLSDPVPVHVQVHLLALQFHTADQSEPRENWKPVSKRTQHTVEHIYDIWQKFAISRAWCHGNDYKTMLFILLLLQVICWEAGIWLYDFQFLSISATLSCLQLFFWVPHTFLLSGRSAGAFFSDLLTAYYRVNKSLSWDKNLTDMTLKFK